MVLILESFGCIPVFAGSATDKSAYMTFGSSGERYRIKAWAPGVPAPVEKDSVSGWLLTGSNTDTRHIYLDINNMYMHRLNGETVYVDVDYYDEGYNTFLIEYDAQSGPDGYSEYVDTLDTGTWKTHRFFLQDAYFGNRLDDADLRISTNATNLGNGGKVVVGAVRVSYGEKTSPIEIKPTTEVPGNIFFEGEQIKFDISYKNRTNKSYDYKVKYTVVTLEDETLLTLEDELSIKGGKTVDVSLPLDNIKFGMHYLRVELLDKTDESYCVKNAEFSYVTSGRLNYKSGSSTHVDMHAHGYGEEKYISRILAGGGYGNIRMGWTMSERYEQTKKVYTTQPHWVEQMQLYEDKGVNMIAIASLGLAAEPYADITCWDGDKLTDEYAKYLYDSTRQMVKDGKEYVDAYIMGNEPEHPDISEEDKKPERHIETIKVLYKAIKDENPEAIVVGLAPTMVDMDWIRRVFELGCGNYMDAATMHPYAAYKTLEESGYVQRMQEIRKIADENGFEDLPIWITENGWYKGRTGKTMIDLYTESQQLPRMNIYAEAYGIAERVVDYMLVAKLYDINQEIIGYGHIRPGYNNTVNADLPYGAHRSFVTLAVWNKNFGGDCVIEKLFDEGNIRAYQFSRKSDGKKFIAMWTIDGRENVSFDLGTDSISFMDCYGNQIPMSSTNGKYSFNIDGDAVYAIGDFLDVKMLEEPAVSPDALFGSCSRTGTDTLTITSDSIPDGAELETLCFGNTDVIETTTFSGGKATLTYKIAEQEKDASWDYRSGKSGRSQYANLKIDENTDFINIAVKHDGKSYYSMKLPVETKDPVTISAEVVPYSRDFLENWVARFTIKNEEKEPFNGKFSITSPSEWAEIHKPLEVSLNPNESKTILLHIPKKAISEKLILGSCIDDSSGSTVGTFRDEFATSCAIYTESPPTIDGVLESDEWYAKSAFTVRSDSYERLMSSEMFTGDKDLSAKLMFQWDDENLYFAAIVEDDIHKQSYKDNGTWRADGFQIGFDYGEKSSSFSHIMLALADDGYETLWLYDSEDSSNESGVISGGESKYIRNGTQTIYEAKIPLSYIMPLKSSASIGDGQKASGVIATSTERYKPENGTVISFSALINDDDGAGRKGYIEYGTGVSSANSANFAGLYFLK